MKKMKYRVEVCFSSKHYTLHLTTISETPAEVAARLSQKPWITTTIDGAFVALNTSQIVSMEIREEADE